MICTKCGKKINQLNHYFIPGTKGSRGTRYCLKCAREERIITLV